MAQSPVAVGTPGQVGIAEPQPARGRIGQVDNPIPQAIERAGQQVAGVAQDFQAAADKQNLLDYSSAQSSFLQAKVQLDQKYAEDKDFTTAPARYQAELKKLGDQFGQSINDPTMRNEFAARVVIPSTTSGWDQLYKIGKSKEADNGKAAMLSTINSNLDAAMNTPDEGTRTSLIKATNLSIDAASAHGWISPVEQVLYKQKAANDYAIGRLKVIAGTQGPRAALAALAPPGSGAAPPELSSDVQDEITASATAAGVNPDKSVRFAQIESSGDPHAAGGGLFQIQGSMARDFRAKYGVDPEKAPVEQQIEFFHQMSPQVDAAFAQLTGHKPSDAESYLSWQQGASGAAALEQSPDKSAIDTIAPLYIKQFGAKQGSALAQQAILANVEPGMRKAALSWTSQQFVDYWGHRFENPANTASPVQTASLGMSDAGGQIPAATMAVPNPTGLVEPGNIDINHRPNVKNQDGTYSSVRSISIEENGTEILIPTVSPDGKVLSNPDAIALYHKTGQFLGKFDNSDNADAYAEQLHEQQASGKPALPSGTTGASFAPTGTFVDQLPVDTRADLIRQYQAEVRASDAEAQRNATQGQLDQRTALASRAQDDIASIEDTGKPATGTGITISEMLAAGMKAPEISKLQGAYDLASRLYTAKTQVSLASPDEEQALLKKFTPTGDGFATQKLAYDAMVRALDQKHTAIYGGADGKGGDPAGYVAAVSPQVHDALVAAQKDPTKWGAAFAAMDGTYDRLGVPQAIRTYLPKSMAQGMVQNIVNRPPAERAAAIMGMAQSYGFAFPKVLGSLVKDGGLPTAYEMIPAIGDPMARTLLANALTDPKATKAAVSQPELTKISNNVDGSASFAQNGDLAALGQSLGYAAGGAQKFAEIKDAVELLAQGYAAQGMDGDQAATKAINALTAKYDFSSDGLYSYRVPAGQLGSMQSAINLTLTGLKPADLAPLQNTLGIQGMTKEQLQESAVDKARAGHWLTAEDDQGLVLYGPDMAPIINSRGQRVELRFSDFGTSDVLAPGSSSTIPRGQPGFRGLVAH